MNLVSRFFILFMLSFFCASLYAGDYTVTIYTIPSRKQIDFSTPRSMAWTAFGNALTLNFSQRKHAMGHVYIELSSPDSSIFVESSKRHLFVSGRKELIEGYGLGILFKGIDGKLGFGDVIARDLPWHYHNGKVAFIKAKISADNYDRLKYYLEEYQMRGYDTIYNGLNKPREGLGAGCTAFGFSFFDVAGIVQPDWEEQWTVRVRVPYRLIGGPASGNFVPVEELFTTRAWATADEPHRVFNIIDPYLIFEWIHKAWNETGSQNIYVTIPANVDVTPVMRGRARGLVYDFSDAPVPDEPVFLPPGEDLK